MLLFSIGVFQGCKKDQLSRGETEHALSTTTESRASKIYSTSQMYPEGMQNQGDSVKIDLKRTVLGRIRENAFTVENMAAAHRDLYGSDIEAMPTTHLYVKFMPATEEHMKELESRDWLYFDFPLEREVIEMGDFYQEVGEGQMPELYAVVEATEDLPTVPHEVLAQLYLDMSDPLLVATSLMRTGNGSEIDKVIPPIYLGTPPYEQLELNCQEGFECDLEQCKIKVVINDATYPPTYECECDCSGPGEGDGGGEWEWLTCCNEGVQLGHPGGCVRVEDTELSKGGYSTYLPVRRVQVLLWDGWFRSDVTYTDDNGCWVSDEAFNNYYMWIRFKNSRHKIRTLPTGSFQGNNGPAVSYFFLNYFDPITHYVDHFQVWDPSIRVFYDKWTQKGSKVHIYWGAATVNNANHEFYDYARIDGINPPPSGLDIMIGFNKGGMTLMSEKRNRTNLLNQFMIRLVGSLQVLDYLLPDVYIGIDFKKSDRLKNVSFHELGHASHYTNATPFYWSVLISAEITAYFITGNPHGTKNVPDILGAKRIALCESWAYHIGLSYTHRTYGPHNSIIYFYNWGRFEENLWNSTKDHIPIGLYNDLIDKMEKPLPWDIRYTAINLRDDHKTVIDDNVSDFTNAQMYDCLTEKTKNVEDFQECLENFYLGQTNNTLADFNALFDSY